jgi:REP element-mobilizing transposase RayT
MPRKPRIEIGGGLYHVITRGNNRRKIFGSADDYLKFTSLLAQQKTKLPFYLYAYCLMPNHVHLLIEMQDDPVSRIMQRVLTTYSQYHNRKYKKIGHVFQGRYKSILCHTDRYLGELVRYIHLNPVRAKMVKRPERFQYSGHRAYIGLDQSGLVDTEPVLRYFGASKKQAVEVYTRFVESALGEPSQGQYYRAAEGRLLGAQDFIDQVKHRIGDHKSVNHAFERTSVEDLLNAAAKSTGLTQQELSSGSRNHRTVAAREAVIVIGRERGLTNRELANALGIDASAVTRRIDVARARAVESDELRRLRYEFKRRQTR